MSTELCPGHMSLNQQLTAEDRRPTYSIIIPAYNEGARLGITLEKVLAYVSQRGWDAEVIEVNDGSRDNTAEIVHTYAGKNPRLQLLENPGNRGKGYSVRKSSRFASSVKLRPAVGHSGPLCIDRAPVKASWAMVTRTQRTRSTTRP
jgi:cellulose synthase/poly-beta-1,6-N-acetylglucosamine synthase-like glycosyltransferase